MSHTSHSDGKLQLEKAVFEHEAAAMAEEQAVAQAHPVKENSDSWWSYPATYGLVLVNVLVFAVMFRFGPMADALRQHAWGEVLTAQFDGDTLVRFGGCDSIRVLQGEWWRLLTACFVHGTVLHVVLNMWCLWNLGLFGERLLGRYGLVAVYMLTGVAGNLLSLACSLFIRTNLLVVGASGAIFGITGVLIVLLSNRGLVRNGLQWKDIRGLRSQVVLFAVANLVLGAAPNMIPMFSDSTLRVLHVNPAVVPHIDNTAHLGGFFSGLLLAWPLFSRMTVGKAQYRTRQRVVFTCAALLLAMVSYAVARFA
ncbi:MAG: rhomboid family intramembrane serine protease [Acidobacteriaceae bacterium]|nr:rhomboid family intramembrane serine protease [Acidobacteriaceae bacterium]